MKATWLLAAATMIFVANSAEATTTVAYSFNTTGNTAAESGAYGNAITFDTAKASTLQMSVTAWQSNLLTNTISSAYLGAYGTGLGVTGIGDAKGTGGLQQIDNVGLYTDFLLLEFNQPVTLASIKTRSDGINGINGGVDNDAVWGDASVFATTTWDSTAGFANYSTVPASWGVVADANTNTNGWRLTSATTASTKWLVGAAFTPLADRDDGFKLTSVTVGEQVAAVPEPATWLTMILGFGLVGSVLRRARRRSPVAAFA